MERKMIQNSLVTPDGTILLSLDNSLEVHKDANGEVYHLGGIFKSNNKVPAESLCLYSDSKEEEFLEKVLVKVEGKPKRLKNFSAYELSNLFKKVMERPNLESIFILNLILLRLNEIKKEKAEADVEAEPAYLFTTEDGEKMYEGDTWWTVVLDGVRIPKETKTMEYKGSNPSKNVVTYSSKGLAYQAALKGMDRAQVLTLNDLSMNIGQLDRLENIAKNRFLNRHPVKEDSDKKYSKEDVTNILKATGIFSSQAYPEQFVDKFFK